MTPKQSVFTCVSPAYGRDYKSAKAAQQDWNDGKDFIQQDITSQWDGKPCSCRDFLKDVTIEIRYSKRTKVTFAKGAKI